MAREELVPELLADVHLAGEQLGREQSLDEVVVAAVALAPSVEELFAPGRLVVGDASVEHEVVVPARDRQRVELDRAEPAEDLEHGVGASHDRARGREQVARNEEAPCGVGSDFHGQQGYCPARWESSGAFVARSFRQVARYRGGPLSSIAARRAITSGRSGTASTRWPRRARSTSSRRHWF